MQVTSSAFTHGQTIPIRYTCEGENTSPELSWRDAPEEAKSFALIMHDPDAPRANGFTHWVLYNIDANVAAIESKARNETEIAGIGMQGKNDAGKTGYMGPCPPSGTHRYFFRLFALRDRIALGPGATHQEVISAMEENIIEQAELIYSSSRLPRGYHAILADGRIGRQVTMRCSGSSYRSAAAHRPVPSGILGLC